jgi:hypothetical protein
LLDLTVSYKPLLMHLLSALRAHRKVTVKKVKAHSGNQNNEITDELANLGRIVRPPLDISKLTHLEKWTDPAPQLEDRMLKDITRTLVEWTICPPPSTSKFQAFSTSWDLYLVKKGFKPIPAPLCLPEIWKLNVPPPLQEILWKWTLEALPLGHRYKSTSELGKNCACEAKLTLPHMWKTCPSYDLTPLLVTANRYINEASTTEMQRTGHPGLIRADPLSNLYWFPLLVTTYLEKTYYAKHTALTDLQKTRKKQCLVLGRTLWHIWKCRMKEIYNPDYSFIPALCDVIDEICGK